MTSAALQVVATKMSPVLHPTIASFRSLRRSLSPKLSIGFVPTMGALHEGHLSLVKEAREQNDVVVVSIFVNPTQFGKGEDFDKYPRQLERDSELLAGLGVDHLFAPKSTDMYPQNHVTYIDPTGFDDIPEGRSRPGHFRGVATIVTKLFNIVQPTNAYFGQKDAAQCCLIQRIVQDLDMNLNVVVMDTIREADGLAMSSRNAYLTEEERRVAPIVYQSLCAAKDLYLRDVMLSSSSESSSSTTIPAWKLVETVQLILKSEPLISSVQYVTVDDKSTMRPIEEVQKGAGAIISLAVKVGSVRLIDNIVL